MDDILAGTMYRVDTLRDEVTERIVVRKKANTVYFINPIHGREDYERAQTTSHSWHSTEEAAYNWLIRDKAERLKNLIKLEIKTRKELVVLRKKYESKYDKEHPVCSNAPESPLCASHCLR